MGLKSLVSDLGEKKKKEKNQEEWRLKRTYT